MARFESLDVGGVETMLRKWGMDEFVDFVRENNIDGRALLNITEGNLKLRPSTNAKAFLDFLQQLKLNPAKYLDGNKDTNIEAQYQTVNVKKKDQFSSPSNVEDILKKLVVPKSFLYRNQAAKPDRAVTSYVPMDAGTPNKMKKFFRLSYDYPFDLKQLRFSRQENFNDRGYYSIKTNSTYIQTNVTRKTETKKYKTLSTTEEIEKYSEDHFYEDLNYNDIDKDQNDIKELKTNTNVKSSIVKLQEMFQSIKIPFFKKPEEDKANLEQKEHKEEKDGHIYENSDSITSMYDSIQVKPLREQDVEKQANLPVEDYLEPVQLNKEYCDVAVRPRDDSILGYILSIFDNFAGRREPTDPPEEPDLQSTRPDDEEEKPRRSHMADRPLPVPVENEPFFMSIDREEAENLLRGQPDGTFVLRPSSQPNHAYTLTVSCSNAVHNVGIRRRPDGRLALGFARRGERSFTSVSSLLRHHKKRRLLLVAGGDVCGATTLNDTVQYYQTPSSIPVVPAAVKPELL